MRKHTEVPSGGQRLLEALLSTLKFVGEQLTTIQVWAREVLEGLCGEEVGAKVAPFQELALLLPSLVQDEYGAICKWRRRYVTGTTEVASNGKLLIATLGGEPEWVTPEEMRRKRIPVGHPILLNEEDEQRLIILIRLCEWAEQHGLIAKGWTANPDLHIETGLTHRPRKKAGERNLADLVQHRHRGDMETRRTVWMHWLEENRSKRFVEIVQSRLITRENARGGLVITGEEVYGVERRETGRDPSDVEREIALGAFHDHDGYEGVVPLHAPTRDENAKRSRLRYRFDEGCVSLMLLKPDGSYGNLMTVKPYVLKDGAVQPSCLTEDGQIADEHWEPVMLRNRFWDGSRRRKYWQKRYLPPEMVQVVGELEITEAEELSRLQNNPASGLKVEYRGEVKNRPVVELKMKPVKRYGEVVGRRWMARVSLVTDNREVAKLLASPKAHQLKLAWKGGLTMPVKKEVGGKLVHTGEWYQSAPEGVSTITAEAFGMVRGVIESGAFSHVALSKAEDYDAQDGWTLGQDGKATPPAHDRVHRECGRCLAQAQAWAKRKPHHEDADGNPTVAYTEGEIARVLKAAAEPKVWMRRSHAWVCTHCGAERKRVVGHVYIPIEYLGMLPIVERESTQEPFIGPLEEGKTRHMVTVPLVTHVQVNVYGEWAGELVDAGIPVDGKPYKLPSTRVWTPPSRHGPEVEQQEAPSIHPRWVDELLSAESETSAKFWRAFQANAIERLVKKPEREAKVEQATAEHARYLAESTRKYFIQKYGKDCLTLKVD
jgi:hypothetical protein